MLERARSSIYRTGIFGNFFLGGVDFAFSKREFPVALVTAFTRVQNRAILAATFEFIEKSRRQL